MENQREITSTSLYGIDVKSQKINAVQIRNDLPDLHSYLSNMLIEIDEQEQKRSYKFNAPVTAFQTCLMSYVKHNDLENGGMAGALATRLLNEETIADKRYANLNKVSRGSFLQFLYSQGSNFHYLGVKIEHQTFLDESDFTRKHGYSEDRKLYKACKVDFDANGLTTLVSVYDTNGVPAKYWWQEFLELEPLRDDAENTKTAIKAVLNVLSSLRTRYPADHTLLRNAAIAAFKQQAQMNYFDFVTKVIGNYQSNNPEVTEAVQKMLPKLNELPAKKGFDTQFELVPKEVPFNEKKYILSSEITLSVKYGIEAMPEKIWAEKLPDGRNVVVIHSDQAENFVFKKR